MGIEHRIEEALDIRYLVWRMGCCELGEWIADAVHEGVNSLFARLVLRATNFVVVGGNGICGCGDVGIEIGLRDIFWVDFFLWNKC